ncbi:MAG: hypothetical protein CME62_12775 [Halobacteriovoraceae bacterium]|nr:hypothetical protein [Halobacteriovoraceae bacterium]|tara:strand:+ start:13032 stop:14435 length:1404 start_codon:yes stop_codon:yes gene_type:complete
MNESNSSLESEEDRSEAKNSESKKKKKHTKDEITADNCDFEVGQELSFTKVRFPGHARSYSFLVGNRNLRYGQKVVAMSDRGMAVGYINSFPYKLPFSKDMLPLKSLSKIANEHDIEKEKEVYKSQKEVETLCQNLIEKHKLDMNLTHVEFTQFGKKVVFYFVAPARVDFRGLVKDLVNELKLRIELRQISVRDRAASMGAIGPCGRELCCSSFLSKYGNVSIKMAKNQNLTLNYSKLNGVCGQLKCCLSYEEEVYSTKRDRLPNEGDLIETKNGDFGKVRKLNILNQQFDMLTDKGVIKRYTHDQVKGKNPQKKFPHKFDNISDETANVIGEKESAARRERYLHRENEKATKRAAKFAIERIIELSEYFPEKEENEREQLLAEANKEIEESLNAKIAKDYNPYQQKEEISVQEGFQSPDEQIDHEPTSTLKQPEKKTDKKPYRNNKRGRRKNFKNKKRSPQSKKDS